MQHKPFAFIFYIAVMIWVGSIFIADGPLMRIQRTCSPIDWSGRVVSSIVALGSGEYEMATRVWFDNRTQDCRFVIWRQVYEKEYQDTLRAIKNSGGSR